MGKSEKHIAALKAAMEKKRAEESVKKHLKIYEAQTLVDKNSRTMVKIMQLLELIQAPDALKVDPDGHVLERIEKLKKRYLRRLAKLAKWSDAPEMERIPKSYSLRNRTLPRTFIQNIQQNVERRPAAPLVPLNREPSRQSSRLSNSFAPEEKPDEEIVEEQTASSSTVEIEEAVATTTAMDESI